MSTRIAEGLAPIVNGRFPTGEFDLNSYINYCDLYYITQDREVHGPNEFESNPDLIVAICFFKSGTVYSVCTRTGFEGQGYARLLMETVIEESTSHMSLIVRVGNLRAIRLYESLGFGTKQRLTNYYRYTSAVEDGLQMER
jgi:ribosomal protein S18 acetylase RimI-like enzyme